MAEHPFRTFRRKKNLTQVDVASKAEVSQAAVSQGERNGFGSATALRISDALGVPLYVLLPDRKKGRAA